MARENDSQLENGNLPDSFSGADRVQLEIIQKLGSLPYIQNLEVFGPSSSGGSKDLALCADYVPGVIDLVTGEDHPLMEPFKKSGLNLVGWGEASDNLIVRDHQGSKSYLFAVPGSKRDSMNESMVSLYVSTPNDGQGSEKY